MTRALALGLIALSLALTGCGTVQNFRDTDADGRRPLEVYGGVRRSLEGWDPESDRHAAAPASSSATYAANVAGSLVADTVTLPVTVAAQAYRTASEWSATGLWWSFLGDSQGPPPATAQRREVEGNDRPDGPRTERTP